MNVILWLGEVLIGLLILLISIPLILLGLLVGVVYLPRYLRIMGM
jgi:hypothetical protein